MPRLPYIAEASPAEHLEWSMQPAAGCGPFQLPPIGGLRLAGMSISILWSRPSWRCLNEAGSQLAHGQCRCTATQRRLIIACLSEHCLPAS